MNLREIWKEDTILDAGGNRSARRKLLEVWIENQKFTYDSDPTGNRIRAALVKGTGTTAAPTPNLSYNCNPNPMPQT